MSPPLSEQSVFLQALQLPEAEARKAYLDAICGRNSELRGRVEALLRADEQAGDFLVRPPEGLTGDDSPGRTKGFSENPGDRIDRYKLLEKIGEGGCGEVYMAEQEEPVRRRVALKIIKLGMDTRSVIARFEAERQALALLDHANIAKVFDGGATPSGRLYFVMELVRGVRITDFCKQTNLGAVARLGLFIKVCQAVQHAHQKGIIHRDLKPANILVTVNDGEAVPKVIDFGIAKATGEKLTDKTLFTQFHAFIGTPAYTSPEQAEMSSVDIDTRSDIYSLGVLLYELLTDHTPFDGQELLRSGVDEMRRVIREVQPLRPSTRIAKLLETEARTEASACEKRGAAPDLAIQSSGQRLIQEKKVLIKHVRGDLDWIVMKCLEKDRGRRYETANGLAADIQRHLNHEPIQARPVSALGRVQRWRQRHPTVALLTGSVLFLLVVVAVGALTAAWRLTVAHRAEHRANLGLRNANSRLAETVSVLKLQAAEEQFRRHDSSMGVAQLAAILRKDPGNGIAGSRLISALLYRNWALPSSSSMRHLDRITSVSFSPDGRYLLSSSFDKTAKIWEAGTGKIVETLQHQDKVLQASFSSDGTRVITASADGTATIWNVSNGTRLVTLGQHSKRVWSAEFSPNGKAAVTAAEGENAVQVWDSETGALTREIANPDSEVLMARYSPDGSVIAGGTQSGMIVVWQTGSSESMLLKGHAGGIVLLAFSANGRSLISVDAVHSARVWDSHSGRPLGPPLPHPSGVGSAALSPDGQVAITTSPNNTARLWSVTKGELLHKLQHEGIVVSGAFSPDGKTVVTTSMDNSARLWDVETGLPVCQPLREHEGILLAGFNPDGIRVVTASRDHTVQVWTIERKHPLGMTLRHEKRVTSVAFTPGGKGVLSASADHAAKLSNATTGEELTKPMCHPSPVQWAELSPDGSRIVTACEDGTVYIWDSNTGDLLLRPIRHNGKVWNAQFSPDGKRIVTASSDGTAAVWDSTTGQLLMPPLEHGALVNSARFSPNGRLLVTASENWCARVWDAETGQPVTEPLRHGDNVEWAEFSPDGLSVVSASSDNNARIWDARTGKPIGMQLHHTRTVLKAVFSPDSQLVATGSLDGTVRIWNARSGQPVTAPIVHEFAVTQVCFSAEGRRLLTSSWAGKSRLWDVQTGLPLTEWIDAGGFGFSSRFDEFGQRVVSGAQSGLVQIWETPTLPLPVPAWFIGLVEAVVGTRYSEDGNVELVPREELDKLRQRLTPENRQGFYGSVGLWLLR